MAFCTSCGAPLTGAFCAKCGAPGQTAATAPRPEPGAQSGPGAAPMKRGSSPVAWILAIVGGLFILGFIAVIGAGYFAVHKAREFARNPGYAAAKLMMASNPNLSEVSHDDNAGTITIRDNRDGSVTTWNFDDIKNGKLKISARDAKGETANIEFGGGTSRIPAWVPVYPGTNPQATFSATASGREGSGGNFSCTTTDTVSKVMDFYTEKAKGLGMKTDLTARAGSGQMLTATNDSSARHLTIMAAEDGGQTTINVTYAGKD